MDVAIIGENVIKVRSKHVSFVVDPIKEMPKVNVDAILLLGDNKNVDSSRVLDQRITIGGLGEYEIGGVKIVGIETGVYSLFLDSQRVVLGKVSYIAKLQDNMPSCDIAILYVDEDIKSIVAKLEPKIVVLYGDRKMEGAKALGKVATEPVQKFTIAKDKLPQEMEVVVLGIS